VKSRRSALTACLLLAAVGCGGWPFSLIAPAEPALPELETAGGESTDTSTLTIEPDVPEPAEDEPVVDASRSADEQAPAASVTDAEVDASGEIPMPPQEYDAVFSEDDVQRWSEEESDLAGPLALFSAVVLQRVRDYPKWRAKFDQQLEGRKQAGFAAQGMLRGVDDERVVAVWLAVTDLAHAKAFFAQAWRRLGVKARVKLSRNLAAEIPPDRENLSAAIVTLKLEELAYFRSAFDATAEARAEAGLVGYSLGQDVDDEQIVYAYLQSEEPESLKAYLSSRETRRIWKDAGVLQVMNITLVREGELMRCR
jgi:hypothetical protein